MWKSTSVGFRSHFPSTSGSPLFLQTIASVWVPCRLVFLLFLVGWVFVCLFCFCNVCIDKRFINKLPFTFCLKLDFSADLVASL